MRHRIHQRKLNRTSEHRRAMLRNMAQNLVEHGRITTTLAKAKTLRPFFEKVVTLAVRTRKLAAASDPAGSLRARRRLEQVLGDRGIVPKDHQAEYESMSDAHRTRAMRMQSGRRHRTGEPKGRLAFTAESVMHRLIETIALRYQDRPGGYTRLLRLPRPRLGDCSPVAMLQLVGAEEPPVSLTKPAKSARKVRADARYAMAAKAAKSWAGKKGKPKRKGDEGQADAESDAATKD